MSYEEEADPIVFATVREEEVWIKAAAYASDSAYEVDGTDRTMGIRAIADEILRGWRERCG